MVTLYNKSSATVLGKPQYDSAKLICSLEKSMIVGMPNYHVGVPAFLAEERSIHDEDLHAVFLTNASYFSELRSISARKARLGPRSCPIETKIHCSIIQW